MTKPKIRGYHPKCALRICQKREVGSERMVPAILLFLMLAFGSAQEVGDPAPGFALIDQAGQRISLAEVAGTPVVLNFWAMWCLPCLEELPLFQRVHEASGDEVAVILVNNNEAADAAAAFLETQEITVRTALDASRRDRAALGFDTTTDVLRRYRVFGIPTTFFVDAQGVVRSVESGPLSASDLSERLADLGVTWPP